MPWKKRIRGRFKNVLNKKTKDEERIKLKC